MDSSLLSTPFSSPNIAALLNIKILSWSQETGFPVCIRVSISDTTFNLHKHPLISKSGYFRDKLKDSNEVDLPPNFPGGAETFQLILLFIYGSSTLVDPFNIASLRCAAEYLDMTEQYATGNLSQRFDIYLNQVILQSWDNTLIVLQKCLILLPWAEDLLIVSRCIETLAFMACMEILDPERRRDQPVITLEALACIPWTDHTVKDIISRDMWIRDLIALPLAFFKRVIGSLRRQGMKEKYVSPIVLFYADKWVLMTTNNNEHNSGKENISVMLQGVIDLLPVGTKATSKVIPVGFYFSLLSTCVELGLRNDSVAKLQDQIAYALHLARVHDFLTPKDGIELSVMEAIFSTYYSSSDSTPVQNNYIVAELWDLYLNQIAADSELGCKRFMSLIETVPNSSRQTHDYLYGAINTFFQWHPNLSVEEKGAICKYLNCQKLSQEACIEAVQNEMMPLRLIVQALFLQQLNTQAAFKECSNSFRYTTTTNCGDGEYSGSLSSPYVNEESEGGSRTLSFLLQKESPSIIARPPPPGQIMSSDISNKDYESTSFRIQNLEKEIVSLKRSLQLQQISNKKSPVSEKMKSVKGYGLVERRISKKKNAMGQATSCVGSVNFSWQRKYGNRIVKVLQRISLFGRLGRSKRKADT